MSEVDLVTPVLQYLALLVIVAITGVFVAITVYFGFGVIGKMYSNVRQMLAEREHEGSMQLGRRSAKGQQEKTGD